jgi:L-alanine-DL-glutamate epimerase-like enolase superfamily enzyme
VAIISHVDATILRDEVGREETVLVTVRADDGTVGYGEAVARVQAVKAVIDSVSDAEGGWDRGVRTLLLGEEPTDPHLLWQKLRDNTFWSCRSGIGHVALAGVDMALWDLAGKLQGVPAWQLMGTKKNQKLMPYVTLYHGEAPFAETIAKTMDGLDMAIELGVRAFKVEAMPNNVQDPFDAVELVARARERIGDDAPLLLDIGYSWDDLGTAVNITKALSEFDLFALEAPFQPHRIDDYKRLAELTPIPLTSGDQLTAASDYEPLLDSGALRFVQGGSARTGVSDMGNLADAALTRGMGLVPWGWVPTCLSTVANVHRAAVHANVPLIEYRPPELYHTALRASLFTPEPRIRDGLFVLPATPGLGVDIDLDVVSRLRLS